MRIIRKFKQLTSFTYPFGTESELESYLPLGYKKDEWGNYYFEIGDPTIMFTCHLDTSCIIKEKVNHVFDGHILRTDGTTILGADDKAGMTTLLYMIENNITGLYYFFIGEERGCVGSSKLANNWKSTDFCHRINKIVSFDRRGTDSIITEQLYGVCCSDEFAIELAERLNYADDSFNFRPDPTGIYTDSAQFTNLVSECTNISVGYYNEHSTSEYQNLEFLKKLCNAVCEIDWESLPVVRFSEKNEYVESSIDEDFDKENFDEDSSVDYDEEWSVNYVSYFNIDGHVRKMMISKRIIEDELQFIKNWIDFTSESKIIHYFERDIKSFQIDWNGHELLVKENEEWVFISNRANLCNLIPDFPKIQKKNLKDFI
jgi:hypothetical protein